ncbi:MAG: class I SAM-dependent methyltransferase [Eubacteriales bacterium]|nr:class I SAM-dependent methyltransferase [Eubacteriales bacterium]MDD4683160.1 class I SAM-dependent methyltransferase [Eubacteriales bacterium]
MLLADKWTDFELIDAGDGEKLERWGEFVLRRPDPQAIWPQGIRAGWNKPDAHYHRSQSGGGHWQTNAELPAQWHIRYPAGRNLPQDLVFRVEPTGFKHTGLFPEQAVNWEFFAEKITTAKAANREFRVLNLFAYTGAATVACAAAGADEVVHLDASKGMNARARENLALSGLDNKYVRFFTDDVGKFVEREIRRGRKYQGIIMDPPSYGRGPSGELWKIEESLYGLVERCAQLLSSDAEFFVINSYTAGLAPTVLANILSLTISPLAGGYAVAEEIGLPASGRDLVLPCGCTARWQPGDRE